MGRALFVGVATLAALGVLALVLLFTVGRDRLNQEIGDRLIRAATNDEEFALMVLVSTLHQTNRDHPAFACTSEGAALNGALEAGKIASAAGMPAGDWIAGEHGESRDGLAYVILHDPEANPTNAKSYDFRRDVAVDGGTLTCLVPI